MNITFRFLAKRGSGSEISAADAEYWWARNKNFTSIVYSISSIVIVRILRKFAPHNQNFQLFCVVWRASLKLLKHQIWFCWFGINYCAFICDLWTKFYFDSNLFAHETSLHHHQSLMLILRFFCGNFQAIGLAVIAWISFVIDTFSRLNISKHFKFNYYPTDLAFKISPKLSTRYVAMHVADDKFR